MLACASLESNWGQGAIYKATLNPFSLRKWPRTPFPHTHKTYWADTVIAEGPPKVVKKAPFNCATSRSDAVLQWCEWILHYGNADGPGSLEPPGAAPRDNLKAIDNRERLLSYRHNAIDFCMYLPLVGFGEHLTAAARDKSGKEYRDRLIDFGLTVYG